MTSFDGASYTLYVAVLLLLLLQVVKQKVKSKVQEKRDIVIQRTAR
jgi:hypothetical protein